MSKWSAKKFHISKSFIIFVLIISIYFLAVYKFSSLNIKNDISIFFVYSVVSFGLLVTKYTLSAFHFTERYGSHDYKVWPAIDVIVPAYNEGYAIYRTIRSISKSTYPIDKLNVIVVDDGSTDTTGKYIQKAKIDFGKHIKITIINRGINRGKRECMYDGFKSSKGRYVVFIDSDSLVEKNCIKELIRPFKTDRTIAGVSGHAFVSNANKNLLTQMQEVRYFNAFKAYKASESMGGFVTCCSGCCSAYRRLEMNKIIKEWINQKFLGNKCTYGDDRSLTNLLLKKHYKTVYSERAISYTKVPEKYRKYVKQQLRWKKSWLRESWVTMRYMHTKSPSFAIINSLNILLPLLSPFVIFRYLVWYAAVDISTSIGYLIGMFITAFLIGLYYKTFTTNKSNKWVLGSLYFQVINLSLFWQIPYEMLTLNDTRWGTR